MFRDQETSFKTAKTALKTLLDDISSSLKFVREFKDKSGGSLATSGNIDARPVSIEETLTEALRTTRALRAVPPGRISHIPTAKWSEVTAAIGSLQTSAAEFSQTCEGLRNENKTFRIREGGHVITMISDEEIYDFGSRADDIFLKLDVLRNSAASIGLPSQDIEIDHSYEESVSELARGASEKLSQIRAASEAAEKSKVDAQAALDGLTEQNATLSEEALSLREQLDSLVSDAKQAKTDVDASLSASQAQQAEIEKLRDRVTELTEESEEYNNELKAFHGELTSTKTDLDGARKLAAEGNSEQQELLEEIKTLIGTAEGMVSGATVAGLAKAFDDERKGLAIGMNWSMFSFFLGIAFLFGTTILLAAYVFEFPLEILGYKLSSPGSTPERGDEITLAGVLSRTIILLAPFWLTLFSARRYRSLFDLRQQYSHKYNMAFSVDGFKKQAPQYAEQMAAWVFHIVSQPPVTNKSSKGMGDHPLPTIEDMVKKSIDRFGLLKESTKEEA